MCCLRFALSLGKSSLILSLWKRSQSRRLIPRAPIQASSALKLSAGVDAQGDTGAQHPSGCSPQACPDLRAPPGELGDAFQWHLGTSSQLRAGKESRKCCHSARVQAGGDQHHVLLQGRDASSSPYRRNAAIPKAAQFPPHAATPPKATTPRPCCLQ